MSDSSLLVSDKVYDVSKNLVQVIIPAFSSLYFGLASIWDFPNVEQVVGTLAVIATFIGAMVGVSSRVYQASGQAYDGKLVVYTPEEGKTLYSLELDLTPEEIEEQSSISFKVTAVDEAQGDKE